MKTALLLSAAVFTSILSAAVEPDIYISFDKTVQADFGGTGQAKANVAGLTSAIGVKPKLQVKKGGKTKLHADALLQPGIKGKAFPIGETADGKILTLSYNIKPVLPASEGAVSMWVKPVNWDGSSKEQHHFFSGRNGHHWLFLYKLSNFKNLVGFYGTYKKKNETLTRFPIQAWKKGEWHHIGAVWNKNTFAIYIDGKRRSVSSMRATLKGDFNQILLGEHWFGKPGQTLIDEVKIFNKAISDHDMMAEFQSLKANLAGSVHADLEIAVSKTTPVMDGIIKEGEYSAVAGAMRDFKKKNSFATRQSITHYAWDDKNLYFAVSTPITAKKEYLSGRDASIYMEDSIELFLKSDAMYQIIFNPADTIYDSKNGDSKWNGPGITSVSKLSGGTWVIEGRIPWAAVGIKPELDTVIRYNLARNFADTKMLTQAASGHTSYKDERGFAKLYLKKDIPFFDVSTLGKLYSSQADTQIKITSPMTRKLRVKYNADAPMFAVNIDQKLNLTAGKKFVHKIKRRLPKDSTLVYSIETEKNGLLYHLRIDYQSPENMRLWYIRTELKTKELVFSFRNSRIGEGKNTVLLNMIGKNGKTALTRSVKLDDSKPVAEARFNISKVPSGYYTLAYQLKDPAGKVYYKDKEEYEIFHNGAPWDNIKDGSEDTLPPPWTPIKGKNNRFDCWNRTVFFGGNGLISAIKSGKKDLLKKPVILIVNGKTVPFKAQYIKKNNTKAEFLLRSADPAVPLEFHVGCEFDGFLYFTGKFTKPFIVNNIKLSIPLERKYTDGLDDCASCFYKTSLKKDGQNLYLNAFVNQFFWCGGDEIGLMGGTANKRGWHVRNKSRSMQVRTSKEDVLVDLTIADSKFTAKAGHTFAFYLQPTPVKPKNVKFRNAQGRYNVIIGGSSARFFEYDVPGYFDTFWKWIRYRVRNDKRTPVDKMNYFSYTASKGVSPVSPAWHYYCTDWINPPPGLGQYSADNPNIAKRTSRNRNMFTYGCLNSKSFFDFKIYSMRNKLIDGVKHGQSDIQHLYFDLAWPKNCSNHVHGCNYTDAFGESVCDTDLLKLREYYLRVYRMLKKKNPNAAVWGHLFTARTPADVFFDFISLGEMYDSRVYKQRAYYNVLSPELMRIAYGTRTNECCISLIPQFLRSLECFEPEGVKTWDPFTPKNDRAVRHYMAYCALFNLDHVFGVWLKGQRLPPDNKAHVTVYNRNMSKLGLDRNYSRNCRITPVNKKILACAYSGKGKMALVVLNDTDQQHDITVAIPAALQKKFANACGTEIYKKSKHTLKNGVLKLQLAGRESAIILFE